MEVKMNGNLYRHALSTFTSTDCCEMDQQQSLYDASGLHSHSASLLECHTVNETDNAMFFTPLLYECISFSSFSMISHRWLQWKCMKKAGRKK
jgi:hypothetical protein